MRRVDSPSTRTVERGRTASRKSLNRASKQRVPRRGRRPLTGTESGLVEKLVELLMLAGANVDHLQQQLSIAVTRARRQHARPISKAAPLPWWVYGRVLSVWHQVSEFTDEKGAAKPLQWSGRQASFRRLVERALPGHDPKEILSALQELGVVKHSGATVAPNARALVVKQRTQMTLQRAVQMLDALLSTIRFNIVQSRATRPGRGLFERSAFSERFNMRYIRDLDALVRLHGQSLLEFFDSWLSKHEIDSVKSTKDAGYVGVGVYVFANETRPLRRRTSAAKWRLDSSSAGPG